MNQELIYPMILDCIREEARVGHRMTWEAIESLVYMYGVQDQSDALQIPSRVLAAFPINQCDGCRRHLPIVGGLHKGEGYDMIACTKGRY